MTPTDDSKLARINPLEVTVCMRTRFRIFLRIQKEHGIKKSDYSIIYRDIYG
jgi:hypothetical protein